MTRGADAGAQSGDAPGRVPRAVAATVVAAAVLTALLIFTPLRFTYRSLELRVSLETAQAVIAVLVALLLYGRHLRTGLWSDFLAAYALALSGLTTIVLVLSPLLLEPSPDGTFDSFQTWAPLLARTVGAGALAWASFTSRRWLRVRRPEVAMAAALVATLLAIAVVVFVTDHRLPRVVEQRHIVSPQRPDLDAPRSLLASQVVQMALYATAAVGFARQGRRKPNPLVTALACGCAVAAFARLNFFLYPSIYTDVVHVGDLLRLLFFLTLLGGAAAEIGGYWRVEAEAAVVRERQRLARQLHDGLAQELAFIRSHTSAMARGASPPGVTPMVAEAAERAMVESRRVVEALRSDGSTSLEQLLRDATADVTQRASAVVEVSVDGDAWVPLPAQPEVGELIRGAVADAVRVRAASRVAVTLTVADGRTVLIVTDDGAGPDPGARGVPEVGASRSAPGSRPDTAGRELRRRVDRLGATCRAAAGDGGGTRLEIGLPWRARRTGGNGA